MSKDAFREKAIKQLDALILYHLDSIKYFREGMPHGMATQSDIRKAEEEVRNVRIDRRRIELSRQP